MLILWCLIQLDMLYHEILLTNNGLKSIYRKPDSILLSKQIISWYNFVSYLC